MSDIVELERRITAALDRIRQGFDAMDGRLSAQPEIDPGEVEALKAALENERTANAQLEDRVQAIRDMQDSKLKTLEDTLASQNVEVGAMRNALGKLDEDLDRLRQANDALHENNEALRAALNGSVADAELINTALLTEIASLKAARAADRSEVEAVLAALAPLADAQTTDSGEAE